MVRGVNPTGSPARPAGRWAVWALLALLVLLRLPALVQPMGPDQGIYAYIGQRILAGDLPYRDAWDHKPPGLHFAYAAMWRVWPDEAVVPLVDLACAAATAALLLVIAPHFSASRSAGPTAAALLLFLGNPIFTRLGGVRIRAQGEVFIAVLVTAAVYAALRGVRDGDSPLSGRRWPFIVAGGLVGAACLVKYQAAVYLTVVWAIILLRPPVDGDSRQPAGPWVRSMAWALAGFVLTLLAMLAVFAAGNALRDLWIVTVKYNLHYSGETFAGPWEFVRYLVSMPIRHARVDGLWLLGGAGSIVLAWQAIRQPRRALPLVWIGAAVVAIAVNGSRGLPQYFVQASPALALAAGLAGSALWSRWSRAGRLIMLAAIVIAVWRVVPFPQAAAAMRWDLARVLGRIDRPEYLSRFGGRPGDKFSALDVWTLGERLGATTRPADTVYVYGFSPAAYVYSGRRSASRMFYPAPVVSEFGRDRPGYGPAGLLADLSRNRPAVVALQRSDAGPDGTDSRTWFLAQPALADWLRRGIERALSLSARARPDRPQRRL